MLKENGNEIQEWLSRIKMREESGQSIRTWCRDNDVTERKYYYWLNKARSKGLIGNSKEQVVEENAFVELVPPVSFEKIQLASSPVVSHGTVATINGAGFSVDVSADIPAELLAKLLEVVPHA